MPCHCLIHPIKVCFDLFEQCLIITCCIVKTAFTAQYYYTQKAKLILGVPIFRMWSWLDCIVLSISISIIAKSDVYSMLCPYSSNIQGTGKLCWREEFIPWIIGTHLLWQTFSRSLGSIRQVKIAIFPEDKIKFLNWCVTSLIYLRLIVTSVNVNYAFRHEKEHSTAKRVGTIWVMCGKKVREFIPSNPIMENSPTSSYWWIGASL